MSKRTKSVKQIGLNTWKVGTAVIVRDLSNAKPFGVAGMAPRQAASCETLEQAVAVAQTFN